MAHDVKAEVDAKGLACPMPIVKLAQVIKPLAGGDIVRVLATDESFTPDVEAWCRKTGNELVELTEEGEDDLLITAYIKKAS